MSDPWGSALINSWTNNQAATLDAALAAGQAANNAMITQPQYTATSPNTNPATGMTYPGAGMVQSYPSFGEASGYVYPGYGPRPGVETIYPGGGGGYDPYTPEQAFSPSGGAGSYAPINTATPYDSYGPSWRGYGEDPFASRYSPFEQYANGGYDPFSAQTYQPAAQPNVGSGWPIAPAQPQEPQEPAYQPYTNPYTGYPFNEAYPPGPSYAPQSSPSYQWPPDGGGWRGFGEDPFASRGGAGISYNELGDPITGNSYYNQPDYGAPSQPPQQQPSFADMWGDSGGRYPSQGYTPRVEAPPPSQPWDVWPQDNVLPYGGGWRGFGEDPFASRYGGAGISYNELGDPITGNSYYNQQTDYAPEQAFNPGGGAGGYTPPPAYNPFQQYQSGGYDPFASSYENELNQILRGIDQGPAPGPSYAPPDTLQPGDYSHGYNPSDFPEWRGFGEDPFASRYAAMNAMAQMPQRDAIAQAIAQQPPSMADFQSPANDYNTFQKGPTYDWQSSIPAGRNDPRVINEVLKSAGETGLPPAVIAAILNMESVWNPGNKTGGQYGLAQMSENMWADNPFNGKMGDVDFATYRDDPVGDKQIRAYTDWLIRGNKLNRDGIDVASIADPVMQAAVLQAIQFAGNSSSWRNALAQGNMDTYVTTEHPQAAALRPGGEAYPTINSMYNAYDKILGSLRK